MREREKWVEMKLLNSLLARCGFGLEKGSVVMSYNEKSRQSLNKSFYHYYKRTKVKIEKLKIQKNAYKGWHGRNFFPRLGETNFFCFIRYSFQTNRHFQKRITNELGCKN